MAQNKRLRSFTIIPSDLYVKRVADDQLRKIIDNMGRPGYVLVARQMGKTNLLLNAKRELEDSDDVFLYVDLSNSFPNIEQFFRNIIDTALDANINKFIGAKDIINGLRAEKRGLPAHKEHEQELRILLQAINGKIVICLDEIDALTKSEYSDGVFSLIRSTYFASRINFKEFNRLTYILSGVAEPNEIIKNKNISPFNIGEKIYLDDFSHQEFCAFITKTELQFEAATIDRIFYWTSGNPRICWDLCSALEDHLINNTLVTPELVDKTVRRLYLTEYDLAPVDHIRKLVEDDKEIRSAVISIHYKRFSAISDAQRNKLYLSGIIKSNFSDSVVSIKNRVIEESLNDKWIDYIESSKLSLMDQAERKLKDGNYSEALTLFKSFEESSTSTKDFQLLFHRMGECYIRIEKYDEAIDYLTKKPIKKTEVASLYYAQKQWLGSAHYHLGHIDESIECYEAVVNSDFDGDERPITYFEASVNLSAAYFSRFDNYGHKILEINKNVFEQSAAVFEAAEEKSIANTLVCAAYHNYALAKRKFGNDADAAQAWKQALKIADLSSRPTIALELLKVLPLEEKRFYLQEIADLIKVEKLYPRDATPSNPFNFTADVLADLISLSFEMNDELSKKAFLDFLTTDMESENLAWDVFRIAGFSALKNKRLEAAVDLFRAAIALPKEGIADDERRLVLHYALLLGNDDRVRTVEDEYLATLSSHPNLKLNEVDVRIIYGMLDRHLDNGRVRQARKLYNIVDTKLRTFSELEREDKESATEPTYLLLDYSALRLLVAERRNSEIKLKADEIRKQLATIGSLGSFFPTNMLEVIKEDIDFIVEEYVAKVPIRHLGKKYGRNELVQVKYKNGILKSGKYKNFMNDISSEECYVVN